MNWKDRRLPLTLAALLALGWIAWQRVEIADAQRQQAQLLEKQAIQQRRLPDRHGDSLPAGERSAAALASPWKGFAQELQLSNWTDWDLSKCLTHLLLTLSPEELIAAIAQVQAMDLPERGKRTLLAELIGTLAATDPEKASGYCEILSSDAGRDDKYLYCVWEVLSCWGTSDARAPSAWLDSAASAEQNGQRRRQATTRETVDGGRIAEDLLGYLRRTGTGFRKFDAAPAPPPSLKDRQEGMILADGLRLLDTADKLSAFLERLTSEQDFREDFAVGWRREAATALALGNPREFLKWLEAQPQDDREKACRESASAMMTKLAREDPSLLQRWLDDGTLERAGIQPQTAIGATIGGISRRDPVQAFAMLANVNPASREWVINSVAGQPRSDEDRTALLQAMRDAAANLPGEDGRQLSSQILKNIAPTMVQSGYQKAAAWAENTHLSAEERQSLAEGLPNSSIPSGDEGRWADWIWKQQDLTPESRSLASNELLRNWVSNDVDTAQKWVEALPAGPRREEAAQILIDKLWTFAPERAAELYPALPEGPQREEARSHILSLSLWRFTDPEAAARFEKENP